MTEFQLIKDKAPYYYYDVRVVRCGADRAVLAGRGGGQRVDDGLPRAHHPEARPYRVPRPQPRRARGSDRGGPSRHALSL